MLRCDESRNIIYAYKHECAIPKIERENTSVEFRSYQRYIEGRLEEDVKDIFFKRLLEVTKADPDDLMIMDIKTERSGSYYFKDTDIKVMVKFDSRFLRMRNPQLETRYITIMSLPYVEEDGRILHDSKYYSFIKMLEQEPTLSYEEKKVNDKILKIRLPKGFLQVVYGPKGPKLQFSDRKNKSGLVSYKLANTMFAMAMIEGYDPEMLWNEFRSYNVLSIFPSNESLRNAMDVMGGNEGGVDYIEYINVAASKLRGEFLDSTGMLKNQNYNSVVVRDAINDALSLDRALGATLAEDVISNKTGDVLFQKGTTVTSSVLKSCRQNYVYNLYIDTSASLEGYYIAERVFIDKIPIGTPVTSVIKSILPMETGMYVSKDYNLAAMGRPVMLPDDTVITKDLITVLKACGRNYIQVSKDPNKAFVGKDGDIQTLYFTEEVLSNRMFLASDVGVDLGTKWVYLNVNNEFEVPTQFFTTYDIAALLSFCSQLFKGKYLNVITNADTGFRKHLIMLDEQYHRAFEASCRESFQIMSRTLKEFWSGRPYDFVCKPDEIENKFYPFQKNFFKHLRDTAKCLQPLSADSIVNPIAYLSALTKINVFTANKHSVSDAQRRIAIGSYGRTDAYEVPQSGKMGVVLNSALGCEYDLDGNMLVAYHRLSADKTKIILDSYDNMKVEDEEKFVIADIESIDFDDKTGMIYDNTKMVLCRCPSSDKIDKHTFAYMPIYMVDYVNVHAAQTLSWAAHAIPLLGANDATRVVFGVAQEKQAKGLVNAEWPRVMTTAYLDIPKQTDFFSIVARRDGVVNDILYPSKTDDIEISLIVKYDEPLPDGNEGEIFHVAGYSNSGMSVTLRKIEVVVGQRFKKGDLLVSSNFVKDGVLTLGVNALVAFIPNGYNYEDGVYANQSFCERLSSYRVNEESYDSPYGKKTVLMHPCDSSINNWVNPGENDAATILIQKSGMAEPIKKIVRTEKAKGFLETVEPVIKIGQHSRRYVSGFKVKLVSVDPFSGGDKLTNRHGNKGVMPRQARPSKMPRLMNGRPIDIANNPLGVSSRMNIGQIPEATLGLMMIILDWHLCADSFNSISEEEIEMIVSYTYDLANSTDDPATICAAYPDIPDAVHRRSIKRIEYIRDWAGVFDKRCEGYLILPDNDCKMTETKVSIGVIYEEKLVQESAKKIHARAGLMAGEPYGALSAAPTHGSSNHGGQREGNMELDALCAYGASNLIHEMVNERGDNAIARSNMNAMKYLPPDIRESYLIDSPGQRRAVTQFLYSCLALGMVCECDDGEFFPLSRDNCEDLLSWNVKALMKAKTDGEGAAAEQKKQKETYNNAVGQLENLLNGSIF